MLYDILPPLFLFASLGGMILVVSRVALRIRRQKLSHEMQVAASSSASSVDNSIFQPGKRGVTLMKNRLAIIPHMMKSTAEQVRSFREDRAAKLQQRKEEKLKQAAAAAKEAAPTPPPVGAPGIQLPQSGWRDRLSGMGMKSREKLDTLREAIRENVPTRVRLKKGEVQEDTVQVEQEKTASPKIRLIAGSDDQLEQQPAKAQLEEKEHEGIREEITEQKREVVHSAKSKSKKKEKPGLLSNLLSKKEVQPNTPLAEAVAAMESAELQKAEDILLPYIVGHSRDTHAYMLLGNVALRRGSWNEAIEVFQQVLKINDEEQGVRAALGYAALQGGKLTLALQSLQRAHDEDPEDVEVLEQLLLIAQRMDNKVLRKSVLEQIAELNTGIPQSQSTKVKVIKGVSEKTRVQA